MNTMKIEVQTTVSTDIKKTWDFYTNPQHIVNWNFASDDWQCPQAENDLRVGGKYRATMEAKDGSSAFDFEAVYTEISSGEKFSFTMTDGRQVDVVFNSVRDKTTVTVTFDPEQENNIKLQKEGWQAILDSFKRYADAN
jgi:uncharacterized protein YndB with AHSA1/START domain